MTTLILDGSNLCLWGQKEKRKIQTLGALLPCLRALLIKRITAYAIFDASFRYRIDKNSKAAEDFETLLERDDKFQMAPAGTPADDFILEFAVLRGFGVLSSDIFRDHVVRKGKGKEQVAFFQDRPVQLHSFQMFMGGFVVPSLGISYLIDESELSLPEILAERCAVPAAAGTKARADNDISRRAESVAVASAPRGGPRTPRAAEPKASTDSPAARPVVDLDYLIELSPLMLRASELFETYRRKTGKAWKSKNSKAGAEDFAKACFSREVIYEEPEGQKKNDGFFFDARCADSIHSDVRTCVLEVQPRMISLIASARGRILPLLELLREPALATGFTFGRLCSRAEEAGLVYCERHLRALLWALIAADGARGTDERETDIATILKGDMVLTAGGSRSDVLNFLQRGILYLLADRGNRLPELIVANLGWILQLPKEEHVQRAIVRGHLNWLAAESI
jgi:Zc3h12a-like Ribonuclease NYN domain